MAIELRLELRPSPLRPVGVGVVLQHRRELLMRRRAGPRPDHVQLREAEEDHGLHCPGQKGPFSGSHTPIEECHRSLSYDQIEIAKRACAGIGPQADGIKTNKL